MAYEAYITTTDYTELYRGAPINAASFGRIALRASDEIDRLTFSRIRRTGLGSYTPDVQEAIKLATCTVAEALAQIDTATDGTGVATAQEKVGSYSYSVDAAQLSTLRVAALTEACAKLRMTGLLYAGI